MSLIGHKEKQLNINRKLRYFLKATKDESGNKKDSRQA